VINKLQDVFSSIGQVPVDLPQIVAVGSQSSGKSSVLEAIVGIEPFLPRNAGICTRRPLVLQLVNSRKGMEFPSGPSDATKRGVGAAEKEDNDLSAADHAAEYDTYVSQSPPFEGEYGTFLHRPDMQFHSFGEIRDEIEAETVRSLGEGRSVSSLPIVLKIFSPRVLDLTLVDLPGVTRVPVSDDQPEDIESVVRAMCLEYISNPNVIILAVSAANSDLANSDALSLARIADPEGVRTIGVLTKLDLMDPGTDATEILDNRCMQLKMGHVGVVNRGQLDVAADVSVREGLKKEETFFASHSAYRNLKQRCGTGTLSRILVNSLVHKIKDVLPDIRSRISLLVQDVQQELEALGSPPAHEDSSDTRLGAALLNLISKFTTNFSNAIEGRGTASENIKDDELYGGSRIYYIFNDIFVCSLMDVGPFDGLEDEDIRTTIHNANGPRRSLFVPEVSFDLLVRRQIARLEDPGLQCADLVFNELVRMANQSEPHELIRYPHLQKEMNEAVQGLLRQSIEPTRMMISNLIKIELSYINTSHPDFIGGTKAVASHMKPLLDRANLEKNTSKAVRSRPLPVYDTHLTVNTPPNNFHTDRLPLENHDDAADLSPDEVSEDEDTGGLMSFILGLRGKNPTYGGKKRNKSNVVKLPQMPEPTRPPEVPTDREQIETEIIKSLIDSYFNVVRKNFLDMVPKTIMYFLVHHARSSMQNELVSKLYIENLIPPLMQEADDVAERRRTCQELKCLLDRALEIVNEVRDFSTVK